MKNIAIVLLAILIMQGAAISGIDQDPPINTATAMEDGFNLLYSLRFAQARHQFDAWRHAHPDDPLGNIATAASYLFEEFYYQNVLTSDFFLNDKTLLGGIQGIPDPGRKKEFEEENNKGRTQALRRLQDRPGDPDALFALALAAGLQGDFAAILEKRQIESLGWIKEAEKYANQLLSVRPDAADAWVAPGAANYIIGCLPAYKRLFLWFDRIHGDKNRGMDQLRITATRGHYLKPFAQMFLALAALREGREDLAQQQFAELAARFPQNPLFQRELSRLAVRTQLPGGP